MGFSFVEEDAPTMNFSFICSWILFILVIASSKDIFPVNNSCLIFWSFVCICFTSLDGYSLGTSLKTGLAIFWVLLSMTLDYTLAYNFFEDVYPIADGFFLSFRRGLRASKSFSWDLASILLSLAFLTRLVIVSLSFFTVPRWVLLIASCC